MILQILEKQFSISKLVAHSPVPDWAIKGDFFSVTRTQNELSIVCEEGLVPPNIVSEIGWRIFRVEGILDFSLTGILASIANPLAEAKISIFAVSTFDTDYILVKASQLDLARIKLQSAGFEIKN